MVQRRFNGGLLFVAALSWSMAAAANTPEDLMGIGARTNAMGGAGTALSRDFAAVYYNPANLGWCPTRQFTVEIDHWSYDLTVSETAEDDPELEHPENQTRLYIGMCTQMPAGLSLGIVFGVGLQNPMTLDQGTLDSQPRFLLYGEPLEQLSIQLGLSWRPPMYDRISFGLGLAILISSALTFAADIPVIDDRELVADLRWDLSPKAALYAGIHYSPIDELHLGVTYRSALFHKLDALAPLEVEVAGVLLEVDLLLEAVSWYSPQQVAFGATYDPIDDLTLAADLTWYRWSEYPGPFIVASPATDDPDSVAAALRYAPIENLGLRDVWVPRIGAEYRFLDDDLAVRLGYSHRPAVAPLPSQRSNLLDSTVNSFSFGAGYRLGRFPGDTVTNDDGQEVEVEEATNGTIDFYVRYTTLRDQVHDRADTETLSHYRFGGHIWDMGVSITAGWF